MQFSVRKLTQNDIELFENLKKIQTIQLESQHSLEEPVRRLCDTPTKYSKLIHNVESSKLFGFLRTFLT